MGEILWDVKAVPFWVFFGKARNGSLLYNLGYDSSPSPIEAESSAGKQRAITDIKDRGCVIWVGEVLVSEKHGQEPMDTERIFFSGRQRASDGPKQAAHTSYDIRRQEAVSRLLYISVGWKATQGKAQAILCSEYCINPQKNIDA